MEHPTLKATTTVQAADVEPVPALKCFKRQVRAAILACVVAPVASEGERLRAKATAIARELPIRVATFDC